MRAEYIFCQVALVVATCSVAAPANADACLDASDEARALLGRRRLIEARAQLRLCAASTCDDAVRILCDERLGEVSARLPTIEFDVRDPAGHDLSNVTLTVDGSPHAEGALGAELTLEPGEHLFVFERPNEPASLHRFVLVEREKGRREHVVLGGPSEPAAPFPTAAPPPMPSPSPWRTAGFITLGASAVSLGIGAAFGITAIMKNSDAGCDAANVCDDPRSRHDARGLASISTASFVIGGALAAGGIGLLLFGPRSKTSAAIGVTTSSTRDGGSLSLTSRW